MALPENLAPLRNKLIIAGLILAGIGLLVFLILSFSNRKAPLAKETNTAVGPSATVERGKTTQAIPSPVIKTPSPTSSVHVPQDYFVSEQGDDSNSGTWKRPFKTIAKGVSVLQPGDTLYIKSGKYVQTEPLIITKSGTASMPITFATAPGEPSQAIISGDINGDDNSEVPAHGSWEALVNLLGSYLRFQNLEVAYAGDLGIQSRGKFNIISANRVHHSWNSGIYVYAPDNLVEKNTLWRTADSNWCDGKAGRKCNGDWNGGIAWGGAHDSAPPGGAARLMVRNNTVFNISGEGIICMHTDYATIEGNVVYDNWAQNIDLDQCNYTTVQKNLVYYTADKIWWRDGVYPSGGIMLSNEAVKDKYGNPYPIGHDRKIINNILVGNGVNIVFWNSNRIAGAALINDLIANNTLVTTSGTGGISMRIDAGPHKNTRISNNLILQANSDRIVVGSVTGITFSNNLWSKAPPSAMRSPTDIIGDPLLVDPNHARAPGQVLVDWYQLKSATSPAFGKAMVLPGITLDCGDLPNIGACEVTP